MGMRKFARRSIRGDTLEHSIVQVIITIVATLALGPASPVAASLLLIGIAVIRGAAPHA